MHLIFICCHLRGHSSSRAVIHKASSLSSQLLQIRCVYFPTVNGSWFLERDTANEGNSQRWCPACCCRLCVSLCCCRASGQWGTLGPLGAECQGKTTLHLSVTYWSSVNHVWCLSIKWWRWRGRDRGETGAVFPRPPAAADVHDPHRNINQNTLTESTLTVWPETHLKTTLFNYRQFKTSTVLK